MKNGKIHLIQYTVSTIFNTIRHKILLPRISFRVNTTDIDNKYELYYRTCSYESYAPVATIISLRIIIAIASAEGLIFFPWTFPMPSKIIFFPILKNCFPLVYHIYTCIGSKKKVKTSIIFHISKGTLYSSNQIIKRWKTS